METTGFALRLLVLFTCLVPQLSFVILSPSPNRHFISDTAVIAIAFEPTTGQDNGEVRNHSDGITQRHPHQHHALSDDRPVELRFDEGNSTGLDGFYGSGCVEETPLARAPPTSP